MELTPARYVCTVDGKDLTDLVREELTAEIPVAFDRRGTRPFRVIVNCPGKGRDHEVSVSGQVRYPK
jgi:hypothetical protein